jgi:CRISPR-associated endonuclease/helicase Cas3
MKTDGMKKFTRLLHIVRLFEENPRARYSARDIADRFGCTDDVAYDSLNELSNSGLLPIHKEKNPYWQLMEGAIIPRLTLSISYPEAVAFYLAGRLLAQTQDEPNWYVSMALTRLVDTLPPTLKEQQKTLLEMLLLREQGNEQEKSEQLRDLSDIFQVIAIGWVTRTRVRLSYAPPRRKSFDCFFDPYLLEPSAIGRTMYAIGYSSVVKDFRTLKMERIQKAELTRTTFDLLPSFKGPEFLRQAWTVMYTDEEPVMIRLRFSQNVTPRVRETRWHPSQELTLTRTGCEWKAIIGDTLEIEPWIRGWGADCEVLEPLSLRASMIDHLRRAMKTYQLVESPTQPHDPKKLDRSLFKKE